MLNLPIMVRSSTFFALGVGPKVARFPAAARVGHLADVTVASRVGRHLQLPQRSGYVEVIGVCPTDVSVGNPKDGH